MKFSGYRKKNSHQRGFTLTEMLITMTLLALIASAIVLFVSAMSNFSVRNNAVMKQLRGEADLREEFDLWFSFVDCPGAVFEINQGNTLVRVTFPEAEYTVRRADMTETDGGILRFTYPEHIYGGVPTGSRTVEVSIPSVRSIYFSRYGGEPLPEVGEEARTYIFPVTTHVVAANYLCMAVYFDPTE